MNIGDTFEISRVVTEDDVNKIVEISGDDNPIHTDDKFAKRTIFKGRIVHGIISIALISAALTKMMGEGNIWLSQTIYFKYPVRIGETITANLKVIAIENNGIHVIETKVYNNTKKLVLDGQARSRVMIIKNK